MAEVCIHRLPRKLAFSRADLAPLGELHVRVERNADRRLSLWLDGPMMRQTVSEIAKYEIVKSSWEVGVVRINKGYLSWTHGCNKTFRIYHGAGCAGAKKTIEEFARLVSTKLCTVTDEVIPVAKTLDLQAEAWKWLVADGVAKRLLEEVHQLVDVIKVMES